jgi:transcriptional regulator with XRE-family HTH domain
VHSETTIGDRLRRARREQGMTQEHLAERSGLSRELIAKIEQGRRQSVRLTTLTRLAQTLDVPLSELADNRPRLDGDRDGASILAIRDALLSPSLLPGVDLHDDGGEPTDLAQLNAAVDRAADLYWKGAFGPLAAMIPGLIGEARVTWQAMGAAASEALTRTYDVTAALMVHMGKDDLAAIAAERAVAAAATGNDELLHASMRGTYAWVLLHQGRLDEAERLAADAAQSIEPAFSAPAQHVAAWGSLLITALAPAAAAVRDVADYISLASSGAERVASRVKVYNTTFAPASVAMQAVHAYAVLREPGKALEAARNVELDKLPGTISQGRHLLDVAQAHVDARHGQAATATLDRARAMAPVWFRHQGVARSLVLELCEQQRRLTPALRELATTIDPDSYAPYHRHEN